MIDTELCSKIENKSLSLQMCCLGLLTALQALIRSVCAIRLAVADFGNINALSSDVAWIHVRRTLSCTTVYFIAAVQTVIVAI